MTLRSSSINGMLDRLAVELPVDRLTKPTIFDGLETVVRPVISFNTSPLAARILRLEMFQVAGTLGVGDMGIIISSSNQVVPVGEVHRYTALGVSHTNAVARIFQLSQIYNQGGVGAAVASSVEARRNLPRVIRMNMLANEPITQQPSFNGSFLDLYPGGIIEISNVDGLVDGDTVVLEGVRQILRGPDLNAPSIVSDQFNVDII